eukprot:363847-Chlamydomonas_euryale.AAC.14
MRSAAEQRPYGTKQSGDAAWPWSRHAQEPEQDAGHSGGAEAGKTGSGNVGSYKPTRPRLDPKDFQFKDLKGEVAVKAPG